MLKGFAECGIHNTVASVSAASNSALAIKVMISTMHQSRFLCVEKGHEAIIWANRNPLSLSYTGNR